MDLKQIRSIGLVRKHGHGQAQDLSLEIQAWLKERDIPCVAQSCAEDGSLNLEALGRPDLVLVLGGDGTIVNASRQLAGGGVPLAGVNLGKVGFLAALSVKDWPQHLEKLLKNGLSLEKRLTLDFEVLRRGQKIYSGLAVNDVVITRGRLARLISLELFANEARVVHLRADGLILSTPTGSSGYCGSAGGPLIHPSLDVYAVTAISPFLSHFLPLVLGADTRLRIHVREAGVEPCITVDGQELVPLRSGDVINAWGRPAGMLFACCGQDGYFPKLRNSGFMRDAAGSKKE